MQSVHASRSHSGADHRASALRSAHVVPRWRAYREALIATFARGRWQLSAMDMPEFSHTVIEVEEAPVAR